MHTIALASGHHTTTHVVTPHCSLLQVPANLRLQHNIAGAVSVSRDGQDFAISLGKALKLDETHQVGGVLYCCLLFELELHRAEGPLPRATPRPHTRDHAPAGHPCRWLAA